MTLNELVESKIAGRQGEEELRALWRKVREAYERGGKGEVEALLQALRDELVVDDDA